MDIFADIVNDRLVTSFTNTAVPTLKVTQDNNLPVRLFLVEPAQENQLIAPFVYSAHSGAGGVSVKLALVDLSTSVEEDQTLAIIDGDFSLITHGFEGTINTDTDKVSTFLGSSSSKSCYLQIDIIDSAMRRITYLQVPVILRKNGIPSPTPVPLRTSNGLEVSVAWNYDFLTGLTGGGSTKLDALVTAGGAIPLGHLAMLNAGSGLEAWRLKSGAEAESSTIVRPDDFNAESNPRYWELESTGGGSGALDPDVLFVRIGGNDDTGDGTYGKPFLTMQAAFNAASIAATPTCIDIGVGNFGEVSIKDATTPLIPPAWPSWITVRGAGNQVSSFSINANGKDIIPPTQPLVITCQDIPAEFGAADIWFGVRVSGVEETFGGVESTASVQLAAEMAAVDVAQAITDYFNAMGPTGNSREGSTVSWRIGVETTSISVSNYSTPVVDVTQTQGEVTPPDDGYFITLKGTGFSMSFEGNGGSYWVAGSSWKDYFSSGYDYAAPSTVALTGPMFLSGMVNDLSSMAPVEMDLVEMPTDPISIITNCSLAISRSKGPIAYFNYSDRGGNCFIEF